MDQDQILALVVKMKTGNQDAFSALYDEFVDRIYKFVRFKIQEQSTVEDILQEVFLKAWQGCKTLDVSDLNFSAWLYRIASNTVNDHYRKVYRRPQTDSLEEAMNLAGTDDSQKLASDGFDAKEIKQAMSKLPESYKQIIELRYFQDFSVEESSKILNKTNITIRVLQHRAIKALEKIFKNNEPQT